MPALVFFKINTDILCNCKNSEELPAQSPAGLFSFAITWKRFLEFLKLQKSFYVIAGMELLPENYQNIFRLRIEDV